LRTIYPISLQLYPYPPYPYKWYKIPILTLHSSTLHKIIFLDLEELFPKTLRQFSVKYFYHYHWINHLHTPTISSAKARWGGNGSHWFTGDVLFVGIVLYKGNTYAISFTPQMQFADYVKGFQLRLVEVRMKMIFLFNWKFLMEMEVGSGWWEGKTRLG